MNNGNSVPQFFVEEIHHNFAEMFQEAFIVLDADYKTQAEFFCASSAILKQREYVKPSFCKAVMEREALYPTGLANEYIQFAIPHTDAFHVEKPFVFVTRLQNTIPFMHMGTTDIPVQAKVIFMLGIKNPEKQVGLRSDIMKCVSDGYFVRTIQSIQDTHAMADYLKKQFGG
ncbi:MAG: PTS sugar transporter subunit IIA [Bacillus sp. (in: Bacteria)]|nr:PTS sugar transporter subunit IIA [Bacillus sp. (in: firmicutes)]